MNEPTQIIEIGFENESDMEEYIVALCASGLADKYPVKFLGVGPEFKERVNERVKY